MTSRPVQSPVRQVDLVPLASGRIRAQRVDADREGTLSPWCYTGRAGGRVHPRRPGTLMRGSLRPSAHRYSYEEYLAYERDSAMKHEYIAGEIVAMAGGTPRHNALASRVSAALESARTPDCVAFQSDQRIRVLATGRATYPDASMVCGRPIELDPGDPSGTTITNPVLIVEVLSVSTQEEDRGGKWEDYQRIPSLQEYVLVSQWSPRVEKFRRLPSGGWEYTETKDGIVTLTTGAKLDLARLYADLPA